jgi:hypothetical protein
MGKGVRPAGCGLISRSHGILLPRQFIYSIGICMRPLAAIRAPVISGAILFLALPGMSRAADAPATTTTTAANILIGFVGGFVRHNNMHHGPVRLAQRIQPSVPKDTYVRVFENRHRRQAYLAVVHLLDTDHDGILSAEEKARARIILFGQSWGGAAAVLLARDLQRDGVPVQLTVQVDSVAKLWQNDSVIPDNVAEAVNFYQPHGLIHGRQRITASNPEKTRILGNYLTDYRKTPVQCPEASWFDRVFTPGHMESECDPHLWSQIEDMVRQRISTRDALEKTAANSSPATAQP